MGGFRVNLGVNIIRKNPNKSSLLDKYICLDFLIGKLKKKHLRVC